MQALQDIISDAQSSGINIIVQSGANININSSSNKRKLEKRIRFLEQENKRLRNKIGLLCTTSKTPIDGRMDTSIFNLDGNFFSGVDDNVSSMEQKKGLQSDSVSTDDEDVFCFLNERATTDENVSKQNDEFDEVKNDLTEIDKQNETDLFTLTDEEAMTQESTPQNDDQVPESDEVTESDRLCINDVLATTGEVTTIEIRLKNLRLNNQPILKLNIFVSGKFVGSTHMKKRCQKPGKWFVRNILKQFTLGIDLNNVPNGSNCWIKVCLAQNQTCVVDFRLNDKHYIATFDETSLHNSSNGMSFKTTATICHNRTKCVLNFAAIPMQESRLLKERFNTIKVEHGQKFDTFWCDVFYTKVIIFGSINAQFENATKLHEETIALGRCFSRICF